MGFSSHSTQPGALASVPRPGPARDTGDSPPPGGGPGGVAAALALIPGTVNAGGLVSESRRRGRVPAARKQAPSSGVDVVGGHCLIDVRSIQLLFAPLGRRASLVAAGSRRESGRRG